MSDTETTSSQWQVQDLYEIAKSQKELLKLILIQIIAAIIIRIIAYIGRNANLFLSILALLLFVTTLIIGVMLIIGVYKFAAALGKFPILCAILMIFPLISLITLLYLSSNANKVLQSNNIFVGLLGISNDDLEKLKSGIMPNDDTVPV
jgi:hypothetical protein